MKTFQVTKTVEMDYGHRISRHDSKCHNVHGHRGKLEVTVGGELVVEGSSTDMVMDFCAIKQLMTEQIVDRFDHCLIVSSDDDALLGRIGILDYELNRLTDDTGVELLETEEENPFGNRYEVEGL